MAKIKWMGEDRCNLCSTPFADAGPVFYDCPVPRFGGRWGVLCYHCKHEVGWMGQMYDSATFEKIKNIQDK